MREPQNPEKYWIANESREIDGKRMKVQVKKWLDENNTVQEVIIHATEDSRYS